MFISKKAILSAYRILNDLTDKSDETKKKTAREVTSALRYLVAASTIIKRNDSGNELDLSVDQIENRNEFTDEVGKVVKIYDSIYTNDFYEDFKEHATYAVGSNFLTTALKKNRDYPGRPKAVMSIKDERVGILSNLKQNIESGFHNFKYVRCAFVLWLFRNQEVENDDTTLAFVNQLNNLLSQTYENNLADTLKLSETELSDFLIKSELELQEIFATSAYDFLDFFDHFKRVKSLTEETMQVKSIGLDNIIYYGPPGTGKTREIYHSHLRDKDDKNSDFITFHQAYSYEEFVEGIKPNIASKDIFYQFSNGVFYEACNKAAILAGYSSLDESIKDTVENRNQKFQKAILDNNIFSFCIDEINRANIAGVFGDLITLIEIGKRLGSDEELIVKLPYSKRFFGVPSNLQLIGSMNTADRSITLIDTALRRRFNFVQISPRPELLGEDIEGVNLERLLMTINDRVQYFLGKDQCIGHAYFINKESKREIFEVLINKVIPLLEEYFYNDLQKISLVLGDHNKSQDLRFYVSDERLSVSKLFPGYKGDELDDKDLLIFNSDILGYVENEEILPLEFLTKIYT